MNAITNAHPSRLRLVIVAVILALAGLLATTIGGGPARAAASHRPGAIQRRRGCA